MQPIAFESSFMTGAAYHAELAILELTFRSGAIYCYFGVPEQIYNQLLRAESQGQYFNCHIRNRFNFTSTPLANPRRK
jgi:hypothetical protein